MCRAKCLGGEPDCRVRLARCFAVECSGELVFIAESHKWNSVWAKWLINPHWVRWDCGQSSSEGQCSSVCRGEPGDLSWPSYTAAFSMKHPFFPPPFSLISVSPVVASIKMELFFVLPFYSVCWVGSWFTRSGRPSLHMYQCSTKHSAVLIKFFTLLE